MSKVRWAALTATVAMTASVFATLSDAILIDTVSGSKHWQTVFTNEVSLRWNWATNTVRAELVIAGMNGTVTTNFIPSVSNYVWRTFETAVPSAEDIYDLTLRFFASGDGLVEAWTGRLAVVSGAFGGTAVDAVGTSPAWSKVKGTAILPYDATWTGASNAVNPQIVIAKVGGAVQTNAFANTAGYCGWKLRNSGWGYGTFDLTLSFASVTNEWSAEVTRPLDGTMVRMQ